VKSDGRLLNLQATGSQLTLPITPGEHSILLNLRAAMPQNLQLHTPAIDLKAPVSNITSQIHLSDERWILWTIGPLLGPAVIYWGELLVFILIAIILSRYPFSPLNTESWLLLGICLSLNNWGVLILLTVWFASLSGAQYRIKGGGRLWFNLSQLLLYALSVVALISLIAVIPQSLLGTPEMGIIGNGSTARRLVWFSDQSAGLLPAISVFSLPLWLYKGMMLLWVLWLSFSLLGWIKWAWATLGKQGYWRSKTKS
jgi:hypothetical protein